MKIDGKSISDEILNKLAIKIKKLKKEGVTPTLAIILVGNNPQSVAYVKQKEIKGKIIGSKTIRKNFPNDISETELLKTIDKLNSDSKIHGIIIQRPLPPQISEKKADEAVNSEKDIDGFRNDSKFKAPIVLAIYEILKRVEPNFQNKKIAVIGKGQTGGAPIIKALTNHKINISIIDSKTDQKEKVKILKNSQIIISAAGRALAFTPDIIRKDAILISIGLHKNSKGILEGDYLEKDIASTASFYTPTPGGVGPVNVACLFVNLVKSAETVNKQNNSRIPL